MKIFRGLELYYIASFCNCLIFSLFPYFRYATTFYLLGAYNLDISLKCSSSIKEKQHKSFLGSNAISFKAIN